MMASHVECLITRLLIGRSNANFDLVHLSDAILKKLNGLPNITIYLQDANIAMTALIALEAA